MDQDRAIEVLEWWVENATKARATHVYSNGQHTTYSWAWTNDVATLREKEDQTRRVLAKALALPNLPALLSSTSDNAVDIVAGVEQCKYALGRMRTDAETRAIVGSTAPTMAADSLHATVWNAASGLWESNHFSGAVQRAATFLNAEVQDRLGRTDISDVALMQEAFALTPPSEKRPRLRWPGPDADLTVKAMRFGILNYAQGAFSAIRNPATHSTGDLERQEALEQLAALSMLARWVDRCELVTI